MGETGMYQILFYDYVADVLDKRGPYRDAHIKHAQRAKAAGALVNAGAIGGSSPSGTPPTGGSPPTGAVFVFQVDDPEAIYAFVASDPYVQNGIVSASRILPWNVVV